MDFIEKLVNSGNSDAEFARGVLANELAMSDDVACAVVSAIMKYIQVSDAKLKKALESSNPTETATRDFSAEVALFYKQFIVQTLEDPKSSDLTEVRGGEMPIDEVNKKYQELVRSDPSISREATKFSVGIRQLFTKFYGRFLRRALFWLDDKRPPKEEVIKDEESEIGELNLRNLSLEVESMEWGKTVVESLEKLQAEKSDGSSLAVFMRSAFYSDYLSNDEARLKFAVSLQLFIDYCAANGSSIRKMPKSELVLCAIALAMKGTEEVSKFKYNIKMLQIRTLAKRVLGDENFIEGEEVFA